MQVRTTQGRVTAHALMFDPQLYPFDFSIDRNVTKFLLVDQEHLMLAPFLDVRFERMAKGSFEVPSYDLFGLENSHGIKRKVPNFIFHHAFVGSTLLARSLNEAEIFFALKEPWIFRRLADTKRNLNTRIPRTRWRQMVINYTRFLARDYTKGVVPVIKMTNVANNLLPDIFRYLPESSNLYLYSSLRNFLISNLKKDEETKRKIPQLASWFASDEGFDKQFPAICDFERQTFLQCCSVVWMASLYNLRVYAEKYKESRLRTLDIELFMANKQASLDALTKFYGHTADTTDLARMTGHEIMGFNAKDQTQAFDEETRASESRVILDGYGAEIDKTLSWAQPLIRDNGLIEFMNSIELLKG